MRKNFLPYSIDSCLAQNCLKSVLNYEPYLQRFQRYTCETLQDTRVKHLICFKQWNSNMVLDVLCSAIKLKNQLCNSHQQKLCIIPNAKVMILQEINEPVLNMAVSKAASLLGADDVGIIDHLGWDHDYNGRIFSDMADVIFVSTTTHQCVQRFADKSSIPVICMMSRAHASIQSLATVMAVMEEFGTLHGVNFAYVGPPHQALNSYLLLCPMLGANIKFKISCKVCPVSPLLMKASKAMTEKSSTESKQCVETDEALSCAAVIIAGPTTKRKDKLSEFVLSVDAINRKTSNPWIFFHTCPRGKEVDDKLFWNPYTRTFKAFQNMHYIAAALMAYLVRGYKF